MFLTLHTYIVRAYCVPFFCLHSLLNWISPEAAVFRSQYTKLKAAIQSPEVVVDELFAKGSIEFGVKEKVHLHTHTTSEKCEILLCAVRQKIIVDPNEFHVFISILQKEPATKNIADRLLRRKYNKNLLANLTERTIKIWHISYLPYSKKIFRITTQNSSIGIFIFYFFLFHYLSLPKSQCEISR